MGGERRAGRRTRREDAKVAWGTGRDGETVIGEVGRDGEMGEMEEVGGEEGGL